jgi:HK97 family phage prohead protease
METRIFNSQIQLRSAGKEMRVGGYAAKYGVRSKPIVSKRGGQFQEVLKSGAFRSVLADRNLDCVCLINHDQNRVLGRTTSRTLRLNSDDQGLSFECDLPNTSYGKDLYESVKRGDMNACSFAFHGVEDEWSDDGGEYPVRTVHSIKALHDVSVVADPAYPATEVGLRSGVSLSTEVDLIEVRSRIQTKRNWRQVPVWRSTCEHQGLNPDTASLEQLAVACQRSISAVDNQVVMQRRRFINEFLLS